MARNRDVDTDDNPRDADRAPEPGRPAPPPLPTSSTTPAAAVPGEGKPRSEDWQDPPPDEVQGQIVDVIGTGRGLDSTGAEVPATTGTRIDNQPRERPN